MRSLLLESRARYFEIKICNMENNSSYQFVFDDWIGFLRKKMVPGSHVKDYAWLLEMGNYSSHLLHDEFSPEFREKIFREFGHYGKTEIDIHATGR